MKSEHSIQDDIINYLTSLNKQGFPVFFERRQAGGFSYKKGIPDLYAIINGKHLEIECKTQLGKLSPMQIKFRNKCKRLNINYVLARNLDIVKDNVEDMLINGSILNKN